ncbi:MAG: histidine kinase [Roseivirga sp.]|nr:histidine kinase [Roseivirga sp.]
MFAQQASGLTKNKALIHILGWLLFAGIFLFGISRVEPLGKSFLVVLSVFGPSLPAVYLHSLTFDKWFRKKKYGLYFLSLLANIMLFGLLIEFIAGEIVYYDDPDAYISGRLSLIAFLVVSTGFRFLFEGLEAKSKLAEIEAKQAQAELESLKSQVNPHFLFNSLNNIYGLLMEDVDRAGDSLLTLSSLLRYLIYASQKTRIGLEEEVKFLDDYMAMERLRLGDKCQLSFEKEGDVTGRSLSPFLLIPFVENAFKHGSFATVGESHIHVKLHLEENKLTFKVDNSTKSKARKEPEGTGIANVKRRLELLMPEKHTLEVTPGDSRFYVKLELSL